MSLPLRPKQGGFLRPFGCGWFIREYLSGHSPYGSPVIDPSVGAPQADIFRRYKMALINETAMDRAVRRVERTAQKAGRVISPDEIDELSKKYAARIPYKTTSCRYHSFVVYFSMLIRHGWVEPSGVTEPSAFQDNHPDGQPRKFYRLTAAGMSAGSSAWANPQRA
ncbi:hypothetical protein [Dehalogenimonas alkenigignens]|uniref:hypothetical protein n=1 Tax=Dehalogenimonas alkenigignens TaxID=1217799 RepID=UPI000D586765|nr:hypothetical protein [Dehalogenimonas alkenigignens]PVV83302.1 hypothetical protein DD509_06935 [Dehalogenimonas alkenigignens]